MLTDKFSDQSSRHFRQFWTLFFFKNKIGGSPNKCTLKLSCPKDNPFWQPICNAAWAAHTRTSLGPMSSHMYGWTADFKAKQKQEKVILTLSKQAFHLENQYFLGILYQTHNKNKKGKNSQIDVWEKWKIVRLNFSLLCSCIISNLHKPIKRRCQLNHQDNLLYK